jgi:predicted metal-dependent hydrolase
VLCYGSHVDVSVIQQAKKMKADEVLARSRFVTSIQDLIRKYAQEKGEETYIDRCAESLHPDAVAGILLFNAGDYFLAHEELEKAWMADLTDGRDLYRGLLQIAVAYYQLRIGNFNGTVKMFQRARQWLDPLPATCRGVDISKLRVDAYAAHDKVLELGMEHMDDFPDDMIHPIKWNSDQTC